MYHELLLNEISMCHKIVRARWIADFAGSGFISDLISPGDSREVRGYLVIVTL